MKNPIAEIVMGSGRVIVIELRPDAAPNTVASFIHLAALGCFDGYAIQRIVPGYVVDVSYSAFGRDECKYLIEHETRSHGFPNDIKVEPGVIAMGGYRAGIAGGEFFFPLEYHEKLDGNYPAFGIITEGLDEVLRWQNVPLTPSEYPGNPEVALNIPVTPIVIERVRIETHGLAYPAPRKIDGAPLPKGWL